MRNRANWQARVRAWQRLLGYLSDEQSRTLVDTGYFDVRPSPPGIRHFYRVYASPGQYNITGAEYNGTEQEAVESLCFEPYPAGYRAFTLLTQAMMLKTDESVARFVANISGTDPFPLSLDPVNRCHDRWQAPEHLIAARYGNGYDDFVH